MAHFLEFSYPHDVYVQQMLQKLPDPYPTMLPVPPPRQMQITARYGLPNRASAKLQNADLWSQFHKIGTEMIITKSGRRMFPSLRVSLSNLEDDANYCVILEMVPTGDSRYKFSGSQWIPAGGAEPQSPQRVYMHPDSPALGHHWSAQPILFNKVKLTNNTNDSCGHIVLTSMHKYQPRLHIIRTSDPSQIPWAPQQSFLFPETEFVAVTAYQNERITKLKIDNNPFAKGFRETGQSRCKRKMTQSTTSPSLSISSTSSSSSPLASPTPVIRKHMKDDESSLEDVASKRNRRNSFDESVDSLEDCERSNSDRSSATSSPRSEVNRGFDEYDEQSRVIQHHEMFMQQFRKKMRQAVIAPWTFPHVFNQYTAPFYSQNTNYPYYGLTMNNPYGMQSFMPQGPIDITPHLNGMIRSSTPSTPSAENLSMKPKKKSDFSIAAILRS